MKKTYDLWEALKFRKEGRTIRILPSEHDSKDSIDALSYLFEWIPFSRDIGGVLYAIEEHYRCPESLRWEIKAEPRTFWVNEYDGSIDSYFETYGSKEVADKFDKENRIGCFKVVEVLDE